MTTHPDLIEAAIRMLSDEGYRVFKAKDIKTVQASYAMPPRVFELEGKDRDDFEHLVNSRVLQDLGTNVAMSKAVRWENEERGRYGKLIGAKVICVLPGGLT